MSAVSLLELNEFRSELDALSALREQSASDFAGRLALAANERKVQCNIVMITISTLHSNAYVQLYDSSERVDGVLISKFGFMRSRNVETSQSSKAFFDLARSLLP